MPNQIPDNPFLDFLESSPQAAFYGAATPFINNRNQRKVAGDVYQQTLQDFNAAIGQKVLNNEDPALRLTDFLKGQDFTRRFAQATDALQSSSRSTAQFSPRTRKLYFG